MAGMPIYQDYPSHLKGQIYIVNNGSDQATNPLVSLKTTADGALAVGGSLSGTITTIDTVTTLGSITNTVKTESSIIYKIVDGFSGEATVTEHTVAATPVPGTAIDFSMESNYSLIISNTSATALSLTLDIEVSPDNTTWLSDTTTTYTIAQNENAFIPINHYSKYFRMNVTGAEGATFKSWFQSQH